MTQRRSVRNAIVVVDPESPWKLTYRNWSFPPYPAKMSASELQALLARAEQCDSEAESRVAELYEDGCKDNKGNILVRRSAKSAVKWIRRAAEHGCTGAQVNLGTILGSGTGITKDVQKALFWLRKAFLAGDTCAANNIAVTYRENGKLRLAVGWFGKAVARGDDGALVQLGIHYYWGKGVRKNPKAAVQCFRKATKGKDICDCDRDDAFFCLGLAYFEGEGVKKSIPTAIKLFQRANVDNDNPAACRMLNILAS
jgi:uncharacterized protein